MATPEKKTVAVVGRTDDLRISAVRALIAPQLLLEELPVDAPSLATVTNARQAIHRVLHGADDRLVAVVGPCSIHDSAAALEYAARLREASKCMVRRVRRTPVTVALGVRPVTRSAQHSLNQATPRPTG